MRTRTQVVLTLLVAAVAIAFVKSRGTLDVYIFGAWLDNVVTLGLREGYVASRGDYPPLTFVVFDVVGRAARALDTGWFLAFKLSLLAFLAFTGAAWFAWTRNVGLTLIAVLTALPNSVALGYVDVYYAPTLILSLWALQRKKLVTFSLLFAVTCFIKWHALVIAPFLAVYALAVAGRPAGEQRFDVKRAAVAVVVPALAVAAAVLAVFGWPTIESFRRGINQPFLSGAALNANWITTWILQSVRPDVFGELNQGQARAISSWDWRVMVPPRLVFGLLYGIALAVFVRREKSFATALHFALAGYLAYCMFNTGVHENHLFLAAILATALYHADATQRATFVTWSGAAIINLTVFYGLSGEAWQFNRVIGIDVTVALAALNLVMFAMCYRALTAARRRRRMPSP